MGTSRRGFVYMTAITDRMRMMMTHEQQGGGKHRWIPTNEATCADLRAAAWSYLDSESPSSERRWIHAHVAQCDPCRAYLKFLRAFLRAVRVELSRESADDALRQRVCAALSAGALSFESSAEASRQEQEPST